MRDHSWQARLDRWRTTPAAAALGGALQEFASLVFPTQCVVCETPDTSLCQGCAETFRRATVRPFRAEELAEALPGAVPGAVPGAEPENFTPLPVLAAGRYGGAVSAVLLAYKNHGHTDLGPPLRAALTGALHAAVHATVSGNTAAHGTAAHGTAANGTAAHGTAVRIPAGGIPDRHSRPAPVCPPLLLVPVPTTGRSLRRRGYDPLWLLLQRVGRQGMLPQGSEGVRILRYTVRAALRQSVPERLFGARGQKGLGQRQRRANLRGTMRVRAPAVARLQGRRALVVDDVLTTGSTIAEAVRALRAGGIEVHGAVVIAATAAPKGNTPPAAGTAR